MITEGIFRRKTFFSLICIILGIGIICSCADSKKLTRERAKKIISEHYKYPINFYYHFWIGRKARYIYFSETKLIPIYEELEKKGLIEYEYIEKIKNEGIVTVMPAEAGQKFIRVYDINKIKEMKDGKQETVDVKMAEEVVADVTGIAFQEGDKLAKVDYTWKYDNLTPFSILQSIDTKKINKNSCFMVLYDDGWRIKDSIF